MAEFSYRTHTCGALRAADVGQSVILLGWVHRVRDLGGLIFVDVRDRYGLTQVVVRTGSGLDPIAERLRSEFVVSVEGIVEAGASNNSALAGAWIPALVFGIPGDSITAIVIGVLYIKGLNPGPTIFMEKAPEMYAIFIVFILANLLMIPLGVAAIKGASRLLRAPREVLMPVILLFCVVGSFAINNSLFGVVLMLAFGIAAFIMEENGFPVAPAILGMVLGSMLEEHFISSMIKSDGRLLAFFERPIAGGLGALTMAVSAWPIARAWLLPNGKSG